MKYWNKLVKTLPITSPKQAYVREIAKENNIHFRVVIVRILVDKHFCVKGIEETLEQHFIYDMSSDLDSISTLTRVLGMEQAVLTSL